MLGWFKKRKSYPPKHEIVPSDEWALAVADSDDGAMVLRINQGAKALAGHPEYGYQAGVATTLNQPNELGHHDAEKGAQLGVIEDALVDAFQAGNEALFVLSYCVASTKEWVFYAGDPEVIKTRFHDVRSRTSTHALQLLIREDRSWDVCASFGGDVTRRAPHGGSMSRPCGVDPSPLHSKVSCHDR